LGGPFSQAKDSEYIDEIFVTTDCPKIADVAAQFGVTVPFLRPEELATDSVSSMDVVDYVLSYFKENGKHYDYIVLLEPTSPLRKKNDLDSAIKLAVDDDASDGIVSLGEVHMEHPMIVKKINEKGKIISYVDGPKKITQRQQADKAFFPYGVIYMIKSEVFNREKAFYTNNIIPYFIERWQNYEVDDIYDFIAIESILNKIQEDKQ
jgi:CMP-N,N'-diacetyllegionaminic acid synthase